MGKWLHAATLACQVTHDPKLVTLLQQTVARLVATQSEDGYLGTYLPVGRFDNANAKNAKTSWDVWTHRYVLYGLLVYDHYFHDPKAVAACVKAGDLLLKTFGPSGRSINDVGTRHGLSSATVIESLVMLHERTGEERFLRFAEQVADGVERHPALRPTAAMREGLDVCHGCTGRAGSCSKATIHFGNKRRCAGRFLKQWNWQCNSAGRWARLRWKCSWPASVSRYGKRPRVTLNSSAPGGRTIACSCVLSFFREFISTKAATD